MPGGDPGGDCGAHHEHARGAGQPAGRDDAADGHSGWQHVRRQVRGGLGERLRVLPAAHEQQGAHALQVDVPRFYANLGHIAGCCAVQSQGCPLWEDSIVGAQIAQGPQHLPAAHDLSQCLQYNPSVAEHANAGGHGGEQRPARLCAHAANKQPRGAARSARHGQ